MSAHAKSCGKSHPVVHQLPMQLDFAAPPAGDDNNLDPSPGNEEVSLTCEGSIASGNGRRLLGALRRPLRTHL